MQHGGSDTYEEKDYGADYDPYCDRILRTLSLQGPQKPAQLLHACFVKQYNGQEGYLYGKALKEAKEHGVVVYDSNTNCWTLNEGL